jgi:hypothetical protein
MSSSEQKPWEHRVIAWADERRILDGSTCWNQYGKLVEEMAELLTAIAEEDAGELQDAIGDCAVVLTVIACQRGLDSATCKSAFIDKSTFQERSTIARERYTVPFLAEAVGKIADGLTKDSQQKIVLAIGEAWYCLARIGEQWHLPLNECQEAAWEEIKDRRGVCIGGVFVKEESL